MMDILRKIAEKENCDELELPALYDAIDPTVLDSLSTVEKIKFNYLGYEITVENETVTIDQ
ncbi:HalOD1 output domain-containing protein [Actinoplanes cyaneus]|uniref:HalOD1 output domain-containing protein n=1 Tax=Actinoplanes cyaneus TaxID=52696 RepID=UPI0031D259C8